MKANMIKNNKKNMYEKNMKNEFFIFFSSNMKNKY